MNKWIALLLACLVLGLVAAGCGDDDEDGEGATATTEQPTDTAATAGTDTAATGGAAAGKTVKVAMKDIRFVPEDVKVKVGDTVEWTNSDSVTHTVTKRGGPGADFDSGNMEVGAKFDVRFDRPGKVDYVCTIHPNQTGTVTVD